MSGYQIQSDEARNNILQMLNFVICNSDFAQLAEEQYPGLIPNQLGSLNSAYSKLKNSKPDRWHFSVPQLEIPIRDEKLQRHHPTVLIGGVIEGEGGKVTHSSVSVCIIFTTDLSTSDFSAVATSNSSVSVRSCCLPACENRKRIVRRFHFDHQPNANGKPPSHIQYGGKFPESDNTLGWHYCLEHFLKNPRWHHLPMDPVLLLDLVIREFDTPLRKWTQESAWKELVFKSQNLWWSEYWNWIASCLNRHGSPTFHQMIYGEG